MSNTDSYMEAYEARGQVIGKLSNDLHDLKEKLDYLGSSVSAAIEKDKPGYELGLFVLEEIRKILGRPPYTDGLKRVL